MVEEKNDEKYKVNVNITDSNEDDAGSDEEIEIWTTDPEPDTKSAQEPEPEPEAEQVPVEESAPSRSPIYFSRLLKVSEDSKLTKQGKLQVSPTHKKPRKGQQEVNFEFQFKENDDPMLLKIRTANYDPIHDKLNLNVTEDIVNVWVDEKEYFGRVEFKLPYKIQPQFTVGYFEDDILHLLMKKQDEKEADANNKAQSIVWCSTDTLDELEKARTSVREYQERYHKAQLDFQNYMVGVKRERDEYVQKFSSQLLLNVLDVQDNFERALEASKKTRGKKNLMTGVEMISKQLLDVLASNGITEIEALGLKWDPQKHEVLTIDEKIDVPEDTVIDVIQKGYMYKGKILRLSKVKVAKPKTTEENPENEPIENDEKVEKKEKKDKKDKKGKKKGKKDKE